MNLTLDLKFLQRAVEDTRGEQHDARVVVSFSSVTFGYWMPELESLKRADRNVVLKPESRIRLGCIETQLYSEGSPAGPRHYYDLHLRAKVAK